MMPSLRLLLVSVLLFSSVSSPPRVPPSISDFCQCVTSVSPVLPPPSFDRRRRLTLPSLSSSSRLHQQRLAVGDESSEKQDGIQDKSSLDDEHDLMKTESQDVATEHKPLYQVHQVSLSNRPSCSRVTAINRPLRADKRQSREEQLQQIYLLFVVDQESTERGSSSESDARSSPSKKTRSGERGAHVRLDCRPHHQPQESDQSLDFEHLFSSPCFRIPFSLNRDQSARDVLSDSLREAGKEGRKRMR